MRLVVVGLAVAVLVAGAWLPTARDVPMSQARAGTEDFDGYLLPWQPLHPVAQWPGGIEYAWVSHGWCGGLGVGCASTSGVIAPDGTVAIATRGYWEAGEASANCVSVEAAFAEAVADLAQWQAACTWGALGRLDAQDWATVRARLASWTDAAWTVGPSYEARPCIHCQAPPRTLFWDSKCPGCPEPAVSEFRFPPEPPVRTEGRPLELAARGHAGATDPRDLIDAQIHALVHWADPTPGH